MNRESKSKFQIRISNHVMMVLIILFYSLFIYSICLLMLFLFQFPENNSYTNTTNYIEINRTKFNYITTIHYSENQFSDLDNKLQKIANKEWITNISKVYVNPTSPCTTYATMAVKELKNYGYDSKVTYGYFNNNISHAWITITIMIEPQTGQIVTKKQGYLPFYPQESSIVVK